jgi:hypothetical protein
MSDSTYSNVIKHRSRTSQSDSRWVDAGTGMSLLILLHDSLRTPSESNRIVLPSDIISLYLPRYLRFEEQLPGMIYVVGGRCSKVLEPHHYLSTAEVYDPFRNEWFALPSMSTRRVGASSIELNGLIYVVGGYCLHPDKPLSSCEVFNPKTGIWSALAPMNQARFGHAMSAANNRYLYVIGGDCRRTLVTAIERYDSFSDTWEIISQLPTPVAGGRMLESNGTLVLVGGDLGSHPLSFTPKIRSYIPESNSWETLPYGLEQGRSACAVSWCGDGSDSIVVIGGYAASGDNFFELNTGEILNPFTGARRELPPLPEPRAGCRSVSFGNKIFLVGGESPKKENKEEPFSRLMSALSDGQSARQMLLTTLRTSAGGDEDPGSQSGMMAALMATVSPAIGSQRTLHSSTLAFDIEKWEWVSDMPAMLQARTAAAVCSGSGFPRSYGAFQGSKLEWRADKRAFTAS